MHAPKKMIKMKYNDNQLEQEFIKLKIGAIKNGIKVIESPEADCLLGENIYGAAYHPNDADTIDGTMFMNAFRGAFHNKEDMNKKTVIIKTSNVDNYEKLNTMIHEIIHLRKSEITKDKERYLMDRGLPKNATDEEIDKAVNSPNPEIIEQQKLNHKHVYDFTDRLLWRFYHAGTFPSVRRMIKGEKLEGQVKNFLAASRSHKELMKIVNDFGLDLL